MGTTGSTPSSSSGSAERKAGGATTSKGGRKAVPPPSTAKHLHPPPSSSPALKKGPRNYVDMGVEEGDEEQTEQGEARGGQGLDSCVAH